MPQILLYTRDPILGKGLEAVLRSAEGIELAGTCQTLAEATQIAATREPSLLLLDLTAEVTFTALSDLRRAAPATKIVLWVNDISTELAFQAMELGIRGILRKTLPTDLQLKCLQRVDAGDLWFEKGLTQGFLNSKRVKLTHREAQLVTLLAQGLKNKEIGNVLNISDGTVKVYLSRLFQKVGVKDRFELALFGLKNLHQVPAPEGSSIGLRSLVLDRMRQPTETPRRLPKIWPLIS